MSSTTLNEARVLDILQRVKDPEIPVISVLELGVVRHVQLEANGKAIITITPTYTGCPAMDVMAADIKKELLEHGVAAVEVRRSLAPAWTTDWITESGKRKLMDYGIAPPEKTADIRALRGEQPVVACPQCGSTATRMLSAFGSTACKALWQCSDCLEPFDQFKCL
jgi:ring-1,2-phenylacetyl-CoA epoxidase subunit PaaD